MGYNTNGLSFNALRGANTARLPQFKNAHGQPAHSEPDGSDWTPAQWLQAIVGELGEYANKRKKFERGDITAEAFHIEACKELADVQIYLDLLAYQLGIDLGQATIDKFNEVSERVGSDVRLDNAGAWRKCGAWSCNNGTVRGAYDHERICSKCDGRGWLYIDPPAITANEATE